MTSCWEYQEKARPSFTDIIKQLMGVINYEKFSYMSFFHSEENKAQSQNTQDTSMDNATAVMDVELGLSSSVTSIDDDDLCGHSSPSHRAAPAPDNDIEHASKCPQRHDSSVDPESSKEPLDEACDSGKYKPSAISSSCSGDSSKGSVKSNGSAFTNGVVNGHALRPENC